MSWVTASAQTDDFNDGNDTGWTRFAPLAGLGVTAYTFPGGAYRLSCNPSPNVASYGPARLASLRSSGPVYSEFAVCVDFTAWDVTKDTSMGILARIQPNPAPGNLNGYALTYQGNDRDLEINRVTGEVGTKISQGRVGIVLDPAKVYRMVFFGIGGYLEGRIFDRDNPVVPLATVTAQDPFYSTGTNGLLIYTELNTNIAATFDHYRADAGSAPPLQLNPGGTGGLVLSWNTELGLPWRLQSSLALLSWENRLPASVENGTTKLPIPSSELFGFTSQYFRLFKGNSSP